MHSGTTKCFLFDRDWLLFRLIMLGNFFTLSRNLKAITAYANIDIIINAPSSITHTFPRIKVASLNGTKYNGMEEINPRNQIKRIIFCIVLIVI